MEGDSTTIPRSARIEFNLIVPRNVEERNDFIQLQADTAAIVDNFKLQLKNKIMDSIKIEIEALTAEINDLYAKSLHTIISAVCLSEGRTGVDTHHVAASLLQHHSSQMMKHTNLDATTFMDAYRRVRQLASFPTMTPPRHCYHYPCSTTPTASQYLTILPGTQLANPGRQPRHNCAT